MDEMNKERCPSCDGTMFTSIQASGGEWVSLIINGAGSVYPLVCLNCGTVFVSRRIIENLQERIRRRKR